MKNLKDQLIRLGNTNPELREHLRPILDKVSNTDLRFYQESLDYIHSMLSGLSDAYQKELPYLQAAGIDGKVKRVVDSLSRFARPISSMKRLDPQNPEDVVKLQDHLKDLHDLKAIGKELSDLTYGKYTSEGYVGGGNALDAIGSEMGLESIPVLIDIIQQQDQKFKVSSRRRSAAKSKFMVGDNVNHIDAQESGRDGEVVELDPDNDRYKVDFWDEPRPKWWPGDELVLSY